MAQLEDVQCGIYGNSMWLVDARSLELVGLVMSPTLGAERYMVGNAMM